MTKAIVLAKTVSTGNLLADGTVTTAEITGLATVATSGSYNDLTNKPTLTTDGITEANNLYFTNARARAAISVAGNGATYNSTTGLITFAASSPVTSVNTRIGEVVLSTTDIGEGTNLYYTNARADTRADLRIAAASIDALADVDTTTTAPTNGQALVWDTTTSKWKPGTILGGVTSFNTRTGAVTLTSGDVTTALGFTPVGAGGGGAILLNSNTISSSYTFTSNINGVSVGPITIQSGVTVTVPANQRWVVL